LTEVKTDLGTVMGLVWTPRRYVFSWLTAPDLKVRALAPKLIYVGQIFHPVFNSAAEMGIVFGSSLSHVVNTIFSLFWDKFSENRAVHFHLGL